MPWEAHPSLRECEQRLRDARRSLGADTKRSVAATLRKARPSLELPENLRAGTVAPIGEIASWEAQRLDERLSTGPHGLPLLDEVKHAHFNPFNVLSSDLVLDVLTDSGTSRLTESQLRTLDSWERTVPPIETFSYARPTPKEQLNGCIGEVFGEQFDFYFATQGRGAEFILMQSLVKSEVIPQMGVEEGGARRLVLSNRPFDTTRGHIQRIQREVEECTDLPGPRRYEEASTPFLGNADTERLKQRLKRAQPGESVDLVLMTLTDNGGGGQPVSMKNYKEVAEIAHEHGLPLWVDACRIFENAMFIHLFDSEYSTSNLLDIVQEMLGLADLVTISFKKMYSHSGGAILVNRGSSVLSGDQRTRLGKEIQRLLTALYGNGYDSYSGRTGRDMIEIISGLVEAADPDVVARRISQTHRVGAGLREYGLPVVVGGHAIYLAANEVLPRFTTTDCAAEYLNALLMAACGIRGCGLGYVVYGGKREERNGAARWSKDLSMDSLRWALPREQYTTAYYNKVLSVVGIAYDNGKGMFKDLSPGFVPVGYEDTGFYHFEAVYEGSSEPVRREFDTAVHELHGVMSRHLG